MNKALFFLLVGLCAFVAVAQARPLIFTARLDGANINTTSTYQGVSFGYLTITKGQTNRRLRVFAGHNILNDTVTGAWLTHTNGTAYHELGISPSVSKQGPYVYGDVRLNTSVYEHLLANELQVRINTKSSSNAIGGVLHSRPNTGITFPTAAEAGTTSKANAIAYTYIANQDDLPLDIVAATNLLLNNASFDAVVISNVTNATSATFNGPANSTSTAAALATLPATAHTGSFQVIGRQPVSSDFFTQQIFLTYINIASTANPTGELRGQVYPTLGRTRRAIPNSVNTISGTTNTAAGWKTLRFANQQDNENNKNSYITLQSTLNAATGNFTYQGFFTFANAVGKRNWDTLRGLSLELNARQTGAATWNFDYFDASTGGHVAAATFNAPGLWTPGFADYFKKDAYTFNDIRGNLFVRVTVDAPTASTLWLDLFAIRSYVPASSSVEYMRSAILTTSLYPTVLGSDS